MSVEREIKDQTRGLVLREVVCALDAGVECVADEVMTRSLRKMFDISEDVGDSWVFATWLLAVFSMRELSLVNRIYWEGLRRSSDVGEEKDPNLMIAKLLILDCFDDGDTDFNYSAIDGWLRRV